MLTESEIAFMLASGGSSIVMDYLVDKGVDCFGDDFKNAVEQGKIELAEHLALKNGFHSKYTDSIDHLEQKTTTSTL